MNVGSIVRFTAQFASYGNLKDPSNVKAIVQDDGGRRTFTVGSGGVVRRSEGVYTIDVTIERSGSLVVRFDGDAGFGQSSYDVDGAGEILEHDTDGSVDDQRDAEEMSARRSELLDAGISVNGKSDEFVEAAHAEMVKRRPKSASDAYADAQRNAWRHR